jgi:hypothetical protein
MGRLLTRLVELFLSLATYVRLRRRLGVRANEMCIICPYGIGDTYIVAALSRALSERYGRSIVLAVKPSHVAVAELFAGSVSRVVSCGVTALELGRIGDWNDFLDGNLLVGHPSILRKQFLFPMVGISSLNFLDCYKLYFGLSLQCQLQPPQVGAVATGKAKAVMESLKLPQGRTVVLCPACVSTDHLPADFWSELAAAVTEAGFTACTNIAGVEPCIAGTIPATVELEAMIPFVEQAGHVVAVRSGLCDLISSARCNNVVIYPDQPWAYGTVYSGTSVVSMGLGPDIKEYVYDAANKATIISEIISVVKAGSSTPANP